MRFKIVFPILLVYLGFAPNVMSQSLLIKNVTVVTAKQQGDVVTHINQWVEIVDGRIARLSATPIATNDSSQLIDGQGKYLIPGLMDSHVHTQTMSGLDWNNAELKPLQKAFMEQQPRSYLYYGITQILDPSLTVQAVETFESAPLNPDLFFCGAAPIIGGYGLKNADFNQAINLKPYFIHQPEKDGTYPETFNPEMHTPEAVVKRMKRDGASCVKVYIEDGFNLISDWPMIGIELLKRVRKAASEQGLLVMAHANALDMQAIALEAEVDILAHGMWNWLNEFNLTALPGPVKRVADKIVSTKTAYQPTLNVMRSLRDVNVENHLLTEGYAEVVPRDILTWYHTDEGQWFAREMLQGWETTNRDAIYNRQTEVLEQGKRVLSYLYQQGHPMLLATDTPPAPTYASQPGLSAYMELKMMHDAGVSLPDLLKAATYNNAVTFGIEQDYGLVDVGKVGNLLLLNKNPLEHVDAYDSIHSIILNGQVFPRESLKAHANVD